jgi:cell division protein FtsB
LILDLGRRLANGKQVAEQNSQTFFAWLAGKRDEDFRQMVNRGVLSRTEIARECCFSKSALWQNPRIKAALKATEDALRERGVLPAIEIKSKDEVEMPTMREAGSNRAELKNKRMERLEQENAVLRTENHELKQQLKRFVILREALATTGRLPR